MARITIEIEDTAARSDTASGAGIETSVKQSQSAAPSVRTDVSGIPAELAIRAASLNAQNAGAAPVLGGLQATGAPMPFMPSSGALNPPSGSASAGAAPNHLFASVQEPDKRS